MQDPRAGVVAPDQDSSPEERDRQREEAARELEELKQAWSRAYQAQGIDPKTVHYAKVFLDDDPN
jgi:LPS sulfotransferase NodH